MTFQEINIKTDEGKLLMVALKKFAIEKGITPYELLAQLNTLKDKMYPNRLLSEVIKDRNCSDRLSNGLVAYREYELKVHGREIVYSSDVRLDVLTKMRGFGAKSLYDFKQLTKNI